MHASLSTSRLELLPGWEIVREGLVALRAGVRTPAACLVSMARPRLLRAGLLDPSIPAIVDAEVELYRLLGSSGPNTHSRFNALVARLVRFEHAIDRELYADASP